MNLFLATPEMDAERIGYVIGIIIGVSIVLGGIVFCVIAVVKAFTRRTTGWIVAGSIGGIILTVFGASFIVGFIKGYTQARQRPAALPAESSPAPSGPQTIRGRDLAYQVVLPEGWTTKRGVNDFDLMASKRSRYFGVIAEDGMAGTSDTIVNHAQNRVRTLGTEVEIGETTHVRIDGRDWLRFTAKCKIDKIPFAYQYNVYAGPEGSFQLLGWTLQNLFDREEGPMGDLAATFRFPPSTAGVAGVAQDDATGTTPPEPTAPLQRVQGEALDYSLLVPADWKVQRSHGALDLELSIRSLYVGVVAEAGSAGVTSTLLKLTQDGLKTRAADVQFSPSYAVKIDGRDWSQFTAQCRISDIPFEYHYYVYAGAEGSYKILGWTMQNLYERDADKIRDVALSFRFPVRGGAAPSPAPGTPAATPTAPPSGKPSPSPTKKKAR